MNAPKVVSLRENVTGEIPDEIPSVEMRGGPPHPPGMDEQRLAKLEGSYDALKVVRPMTITVIGVFLAALVFVLGLLTTQINSINTKLDAIPQRLSEEFRAMRAEMAAQTTALANSITATKQAPPQVIVLPMPPQPSSAPTQEPSPPPR